MLYAARATIFFGTRGSSRIKRCFTLNASRHVLGRHEICCNSALRRRKRVRRPRLLLELSTTCSSSSRTSCDTLRSEQKHENRAKIDVEMSVGARRGPRLAMFSGSQSPRSFQSRMICCLTLVVLVSRESLVPGRRGNTINLPVAPIGNPVCAGLFTSYG